MRVVLLSADLMVVSRVQGAARGGMPLSTATSVQQAVERCRADAADVLIVDLSLPDLDIAALVGELKASGDNSTRVIAFGPHVHEQRLAAARAAGCDLVTSRGQFFAQADVMLGGLR